MGLNEVRHLRRCSRSGVCTQSKCKNSEKKYFKRVLNVDEFSNQFFNHSLDRKESTLRVWDHRFAKRSFCGGLWSRGAAKVKRKFSIKILLINVCQTFSEKNGFNFFIGSTPSQQFQPSSRNSRLISYCPFPILHSSPFKTLLSEKIF